jgi:hypothetical protein
VDALWIKYADGLKKLSESELEKELNLFFFWSGGLLLLSLSEKFTCPNNAAWNASCNILLKAVFDPDYEAKYFRVLTNEEGVPDDQKNKGCQVIPENTSLLPKSLNGKKSKTKKN